MLNLDDYTVEMEELEPGMTIRVNHSACRAGEDTRRRMYLTRPVGQPDRVLAFCHNCQTSGIKTTKDYEDYRRDMHKNVTAMSTSEVDIVTPPPNMITNVKLWPTDAVSWLFKNKLKQSLVTQYYIAFDPSTHRVYLPKYDRFPVFGMELTGYQLRKVRPDKIDSGPKYVTVRKQDDNGFTKLVATRATRNPEEITILVEDLVSGIHLRYALPDSCEVIVNYGVKVNLEALFAAKNSRKFIVWLDNDSSYITNQAKVMCRTWDLLKTHSDAESVCIEDYSDPKHYTQDEIQRHLIERNAWTP